MLEQDNALSRLTSRESRIQQVAKQSLSHCLELLVYDTQTLKTLERNLTHNRSLLQ